MRKAQVERKTKETEITAKVDLDGSGNLIAHYFHVPNLDAPAAIWDFFSHLPPRPAEQQQ